MAFRKDPFSVLVISFLLVLLDTTEAPDPCCLRVTPYHIQALAQRMAQRFQALEYRAQDLRGVFASFQAVHGNVSHRLRYLEMEHAHLGEMVSRLDSRVQMLEEEKKREEYRHRVGYYRTRRGTSVDRYMMNENSNKHYLYKSHLKSGRLPVYTTHIKSDKRFRAYPSHSFRKSESEQRQRSVTPDGNKEQRLAFPYVRLRRQDIPIVLPPLRVHLDQPEEPAPDMTSQEEFLLPTAASVGGEESPSHSDPPREQEESVPASESGPSPTELSSSSADDAESQPQFFDGAEAAAASNDVMNGGGTTPTPLWQLEESADALLQAMSAGDEDDSVMMIPATQQEGDHDDESVSFWEPANETNDSLERLYDAAANAVVEPTATTRTNTDHHNGTEASGMNVSHDSATTSTTTPEEDHHAQLALNTLDLIPSPSDDVQDTTNGTRSTSDIDNTIPVMSTAKTKTGCQSSITTHNNVSLPTTPTNDSSSSLMMDFLESGSGVEGMNATTGNGSACEGSGCLGASSSAELSDAELQDALRELDALLQQRPSEAASASQPPDPEKLLLKRALTLALAALERTSDACLTLVNFTADAFEGLAAAEGGMAPAAAA